VIYRTCRKTTAARLPPLARGCSTREAAVPRGEAAVIRFLRLLLVALLLGSALSAARYRSVATETRSGNPEVTR
jgi:hypothetical protein